VVFPYWLRWGNIAKYSGRNLAGQDRAMNAISMHSEVFTIAMDIMSKNPELRNNPAKLMKEAYRVITDGRIPVDEIVSKVKEEIAAIDAASDRRMSDIQRERYYKIRTRELAYDALDIPLEEKEAAKDLSSQSIFTGERGGAISHLADFIGRIASGANPRLKTAWTLGVKIPFIPFTKIVGNVGDYMLDHTPYGILRAFNLGGTGLVQRAGNLISSGSMDDMKTSQMGQMGSKQFEEQLARGISGTAILVIAAALQGDDRKDDFYITGGFGDDEEKYSIYSNGKRMMTYKNIAHLAIPLGLIGNASEASKYASEPNQSQSERIALATLVTMSMMKEQSFLKGVKDLTTMVSDVVGDARDTKSAGKTTARAFERLGTKYGEVATGTLVTNNALLEQIEKIIDPRKMSKETVSASLLYLSGLQRPLSMAGVEGPAYPILDIFGREVKLDPDMLVFLR
jgi:hypothetical protein